jgi:tetratricopeptide (TPR) repeat protein
MMSRELSILYIALAVMGAAIVIILLVKMIAAIRAASLAGRLAAERKMYRLAPPRAKDTRFSLAVSQEWQGQTISEHGEQKSRHFRGTLFQRIRSANGEVSQRSQQMFSSLLHKTNSTQAAWSGAASSSNPRDPNPRYADALKMALEVAERFNNEGKFDEAIANYTAALEMHPNYLPALFGRGLIYAQTRRDVEAVVDLTNALMLAPDRGILYAPRSLSLMRLGRIPEATRDLERFFKFSGFGPTAAVESEVVVSQMKTLLRVDGYDFDERISNLTRPLLDEIRHNGDVPEEEFNRKIADLVTQLLDEPQDDPDGNPHHDPR